MGENCLPILERTLSSRSDSTGSLEAFTRRINRASNSLGVSLLSWASNTL